MKKVLLSLFLAASGVLVVHAQSSGYNITDVNSTIINGQTLDVWADSNASLLTIDFDVTNTGTLLKNTYMERHELSIVPGTQNYFCWDVCYPPFVGASTTGVNINAGGTYTLGTVDYQPQGQLGTSTIRYVIWDFQNPNDSVWFIVNWHITPVSVEEHITGSLFNAFPNPAYGQTQIKYELEGADQAIIRIYNMLGEVIRNIPVNGTKGNLTVDVSSFQSGIYFYSLVSDEKILATKKFTVTR